MSGSAIPTNTGETIIVGTQSIFIINTSNVSKLTSTNYLMWSLKIHALLDGYALSSYLDGSHVVPPPIIMVDQVASENPAFVIYKRQDRLIYSALLGAISTMVHPVVSRATTSSHIWSTLASTYANPSCGHVRQLKTQVEQWSKGSKTIDEYMRGLLTRFDELALLGKPYEHEDQVEIVLKHLPDEYKLIVDQIEARDVAPLLPEIHERLINHELKLATSAANTSMPLTANVSHTRYN